MVADVAVCEQLPPPTTVQEGEAEIGEWDLLGNRHKAGVIGAVVADDNCMRELFGSSCRLWRRRGYAQLHITDKTRSLGWVRGEN